MPNSAASRLVLSAYSESVVADAARSILEEVGGRVSCAFVFCSSDYRAQLGDFLEVLQVNGHIPLIVGSSGGGLVGTAVETESARGFSVLALNLPDTQLVPLSFSGANAPAWDDADAWRKAAGGDDADAWLLLADPSAVPAEQLLATWESAFPGAPCFGGLASGLNNDCPVADAPAGVTSLTIQGRQTDGSGAVTLCISRPDKLATQTLALGPDAVSSDVRLIDLGGSTSGCTFTQDTTRIPTGTVRAAGLCGNGSDAAGFELIVDGAASLTRTCGATVDTVGVTLVGSVAVHPM